MLIFSWLFLGFPQIFNFPSGIEEAQAADLIGSWTAGLSHTAESGSNRALIFIAHAESSGTGLNLATVTYGGQAMTKIVEYERLMRQPSSSMKQALLLPQAVISL